MEYIFPHKHKKLRAIYEDFIFLNQDFILLKSAKSSCQERVFQRRHQEIRVQPSDLERSNIK